MKKMFFVILLTLANSLFAGPSPKSFLPLIICPNNVVESLSLYEAQYLRSQVFTPSVDQDKIFDYVLGRVSLFSPARARHYKNRLEEFYPNLKWIQGGLLNLPSYNEIALPEKCQVSTLGVLEFDPQGQISRGHIDLKLWGRLSALQKASTLLEMLVLEEMSLKNEGRDLGSRAFVGYALSENSPLQDVRARFEILERIGLPFAEMDDPSMCISLEHPREWREAQIISGQGFSDPLNYRECLFNWQEQNLNISGKFAFYPDGQLAKLTVGILLANDPFGYRHDSLSSQYGYPMVFSGDDLFTDPLQFYPKGEMKYGHLRSDERLILSWKEGRIRPGSAFNLRTQKTLSTQLAFWENGLPRRLAEAHGEILIQGRWQEFSSQNVLFYSSGKVECVELRPQVKLRKKNGREYQRSSQNAYVCFDENGFPEEKTYTSAQSPDRSRASYFPFQGEN